jgi:hypothetical protein
MTETEARADAARRNEAGDEPGFWAAQRAEGGAWRVVRLTAPGLTRTKPTGAHAESRPRPEEPADPRPVNIQNVPPFGGY